MLLLLVLLFWPLIASLYLLALLFAGPTLLLIRLCTPSPEARETWQRMAPIVARAQRIHKLRRRRLKALRRLYRKISEGDSLPELLRLQLDDAGASELPILLPVFMSTALAARRANQERRAWMLRYGSTPTIMNS